MSQNKKLNVTVDGFEYTLNVEAAIKSGILVKNIKRTIGQLYQSNVTGYYYLLACVDPYRVNFIDIHTGLRHPFGGIAVKNCNDISSEEWDRFMKTCQDDFTFVPQWRVQIRHKDY
jgi:hypothetical protein